MKKRKRPVKAHGQVRQSQVVTTFGPGATMDLPDFSVLIGGLDDWNGGEEIREPRLVEKLGALLGVHGLSLKSPPPALDRQANESNGIKVWRFPEWFITQDTVEDAKRPGVRSRRLINITRVNRGNKFQDGDRNVSVVPVRFVRACRRGHIGDIDWYAFVHSGVTPCRRDLWIDQMGTSGDLAVTTVRCECGAERAIGEAAFLKNQALGSCDGSRPWLGRFSKEQCGEPNRLLVRTASNAYFPQVMSVISLPDREDPIAVAVGDLWKAYLEHVADASALKALRGIIAPVRERLDGISDEAVMAQINAKRLGAAKELKPVKQAELETLLTPGDVIGEDAPDTEFYGRVLPRSEWDSPVMAGIDRVVLVHRLREVVAQVGFTRFEPSAPDVDGELEMGVKRAALARDTLTWLPAIENRGEGVFLGFKREAIHAWLADPKGPVARRDSVLSAGFDGWMKEHKNSHRVYFGAAYVMLHSLSHLLITAVSLECGYPASSIRERIYAGSAGYGILLYTGSPDAEGTLGGLVEVGKRIQHHVAAALELGRLCSNDPVCAQHCPPDENEHRFLVGSACHGCLLIAETSCEQHNDFLDRALVVPTVENLGAEFFRVG